MTATEESRPIIASQYTLTHTDDPTLSVVVGPPTEAAWSDYLIESSRAGENESQYNLLLACARTPSRSELERIVERDWPDLPSEAWPLIIDMGGAVAPAFLRPRRGVGPRLTEAEANARELDLRRIVDEGHRLRAEYPVEQIEQRFASLPAFGAITPEVEGKAREAWAQLQRLDESGAGAYQPNEWDALVQLGKHLAAHDAYERLCAPLVRERLTWQHAADWLGQYARPGALMVLDTLHGLVAMRRPRFGERNRYDSDRASADVGPYQAALHLLSAVLLHPGPGEFREMARKAPCLASTLAHYARLMCSGSQGAEVKKG